jgi:hypothetical protein
MGKIIILVNHPRTDFFCDGICRYPLEGEGGDRYYKSN